MSIYKYIIHTNHHDPRAVQCMNEAQALGFHNLERIAIHDLFFIEGQLSRKDLGRLALELLSDPVTQTATWTELPAPLSPPEAGTVILELSLRPGVTDPVAAELVRAAHELGFSGVQRAATGQRFILGFSKPDPQSVEQIARRLLVNAVIQHWVVGEIEPSFPLDASSSGEVVTLPVRELGADELLALSKERRAALDLAEMQAIQNYYLKEGRDPTDVEFETIAQTWSEHCGHKTFKAVVDVEGSGGNFQVDSLIKTYLKSATDKINAPWVISAFEDNAGIIEFDDEFEVSFKVETHNHPSAIEPFGGANTGVGGVIRDVIGVSAKPIANTDVLCFGPQDLNMETLPDGVLHPRRIQSGVVAGVQDYGNKIGIPTVNGAILYDEGYTANPLVFCGCVGLAPKGKHVHTPRKGDRVILLGGRTGRDGLRGATFSSMTMDAQTGEVAGASVQIGDPITEKGLIDVIVRARDLGLYTAITDCGAGGLSSAAGEMAATIGADIELADVRLKYPGLAPWEIWLSEAQERMVLAVPSENLPALQELCDTFDTELTDIGTFTGSGRLIVKYHGQTVLDMDNQFLHEGIPQRKLKASVANHPFIRFPNPLPHPATTDTKGIAPVANHPLIRFPNPLPHPTAPPHPFIRFPNPLPHPTTADTKDILLKLLSHPNIASKASVIRIYDHEVQGGTVVKPLTGVAADAPSDAAVLKPIGTKGLRGIVLSNGINPEYGKRDAYQMALAVVDEAIRNAVAVGADPDHIAILDNFCWGDPLRPETMGALVEAACGCHDAALLFGTPFISGKDSLNNEYLGADNQRHAIPPTLLISAIGLIQNFTQAVTMDLKEAGNHIYLVGKFQPVFGGSHFSLVTPQVEEEQIPDTDEVTPKVYRALHRAILAGLVRSAHDISEGGLAVAAAEMCIGGRLGMKLEISSWQDHLRTLFGETTGSLLVEVREQDKDEFVELMGDLPLTRVGTVVSDANFSVTFHTSAVLEIPLESLISAWNKTL